MVWLMTVDDLCNHLSSCGNQPHSLAHLSALLSNHTIYLPTGLQPEAANDLILFRGVKIVKYIIITIAHNGSNNWLS